MGQSSDRSCRRAACTSCSAGCSGRSSLAGAGCIVSPRTGTVADGCHSSADINTPARPRRPHTGRPQREVPDSSAPDLLGNRCARRPACACRGGGCKGAYSWLIVLPYRHRCGLARKTSALSNGVRPARVQDKRCAELSCDFRLIGLAWPPPRRNARSGNSLALGSVISPASAQGADCGVLAGGLAPIDPA